MNLPGSDVLTRVEARIAEKVGPQRYKVWFKNATHFHITDGFIKVGVPNMFIGGWIENHFSDVIAEAVQEVTDMELEVRFSIDPSLAKNLKKRQLDSQVSFMANNPERVAREHRKTGYDASRRTLRGKLGDFIVGPSNEFAFGCAKSVIEHPGQQFSPLFIHGSCGLGKTHLLQGIFNAIKEHENLTAIYVSGEEFTNHFVYSIKSGNRDAFRHRYRNADILLIDDVHFLANKKATQEEFLHTFNAIDAVGKQIVLASDTHPKLIGNLSESLVNRFVAGMVVKVEAPSLDERVRILQSRCVQMRKEIPGPVLEYVASQIDSNVRELEGALLKLLAFASISRQPITLALAQQALHDHLSKTAPIVKLSDIESVSAIFFGLTPGDLHTSRKTRTIALARGIAMYLARKHTDMSFPEIGRLMGNKNHSTVILACAKMNKILEADGDVRWNAPAGERKMRLKPLIAELEEQLGLKEEVAPTEPLESTSATEQRIQETALPTPDEGFQVAEEPTIAPTATTSQPPAGFVQA